MSKRTSTRTKVSPTDHNLISPCWYVEFNKEEGMDIEADFDG